MKKYATSLIALAVIVIVIIATVVVVSVTSNDKIGEGSNNDISNTKFIKSQFTDSFKDESLGKVLHKGVIATDIIIKGSYINDGIMGVNFISRGKPATIVALVCESRSDTWAMAHNTYRADGTGVTNATNVSIMNYPKGVTDIREIDEARNPVFSTAQGDTNIYEGLLKLQYLDPESTVAFTFDVDDNHGGVRAEGWSSLYKVKDIVAGLKKVNLRDCKNASVPPEGMDVQFVSNDDMRAMAKANK